jgi:hypothetical protein
LLAVPGSRAGEVSGSDAPTAAKQHHEIPRVGLKPYLLENAPRPLDPVTKQRAFDYRTNLEGAIFQLERLPAPSNLGTRDTLRGARSELSRIRRELHRTP